MNCDHYFYNCSKEYIDSIHPSLYEEIIGAINNLPRCTTQSEINQHLFILLTAKGWSYDSLPPGVRDLSQVNITEIESNNNRSLCVTSSTLGANWHSDFAKSFDDLLVQVEAQFGKVESMFKDFCGFRIAYYERRLALGIEIVLSEPNVYFAHRKSSISGMAYFDIAKRTLPAIGLGCPIWLVGVRD